MVAITSLYPPETNAEGKKLRTKAKKIAIAIFVSTPADATKTSAKHPLSIYGLYGTGFAHPATPPEERRNTTGTTKDPIKSRCFKGFGVKRPAIFAVESPQRSAAYPWATS